MKRGLIISVCVPFVGACDGTEGPLLDLPVTSAGEPSTGSPPLGAGGADGEAGTGGTRDPDAVPPRFASFQIQLSGDVDVNVDAEMFIIDFSGPSDSVFDDLKARSRFIGCYFSAGSFEPWRDDADEFSSGVRGDPLPSYPNEEWLDVTQEEVVALMSARISVAAQRGCDAVYPSIVRPDTEAEGFMISDVAFAVYAGRLVDAAHSAGVSAIYAGSAQPNGEESAYDAALVFGCVEAGTCDPWLPFSESGKGVYLVEWGDAGSASTVCAGGRPAEWPTIVKAENLSSFREECP